MRASVWMPVDEVRQLRNKDRVKHVLYYACYSGFELLGDLFLTQLKSIRNRHQEGCTTLCQLLENPVLRPLHLMLYKDRRFVIYMEKYGRAKIKEEMNKSISSPRLKKQVADVPPESFESFLYVEVDREHRRHAPFTRSLICTCVDNSETIIKDPDLIDLHSIPPLRDNMTEPPLLEDWTTFQRNCALITVVALGMLCYTQSKRSNIVQRVNTQFAFANNVPKQFVESFHQMSLLVSYKSLRRSLQANAKAVMEEILEKTQTRQFFISYDNMNFYENVRDQRIYNCSSLISYTTGYICFMKTPNGIENPTNSWEDEYIDSSQVDRRLVNQLKESNFELKQADKDYRSVAVRYTFSKVLKQYFATVMRKQKHDRNIPIHRKWPSPLPNIRCRLKKADILPLPTLAINEGTIPGSIDIVQELAERLELSDEIIRDKLILLKGNLMTVRNCQRVIYRRQEEILTLDRFYWLEPVTGLFHL